MVTDFYCYSTDSTAKFSSFMLSKIRIKMTFIRNVVLFCGVITLIKCSGLRKSDKNDKETLVSVTTEYGKMLIELSDKTPKHKANFIKLAKEGYYDSLMFHRVMNGFMIQGGDPDSKNAKPGKGLGNGSPGYTIPAEFDSTLFHQKGALAAARQPDQVNPKKASNGSQFYIAQGRVYPLEQLNSMEKSKQRSNPDFKFSMAQKAKYSTVGGILHLDGNYTVFGQVIKGLDVLDKIAAVKVNARINHRPLEDIRMFMEVIEVTPKQKEKLLNKEGEK